jgi:hypothetical protein
MKQEANLLTQKYWSYEEPCHPWLIVEPLPRLAERIPHHSAEDNKPVI